MYLYFYLSNLSLKDPSLKYKYRHFCVYFVHLLLLFAALPELLNENIWLMRNYLKHCCIDEVKLVGYVLAFSSCLLNEGKLGILK